MCSFEFTGTSRWVPLYSTQAELVTLHYLKSFNVVRMCKNNIFASTFIGLISLIRQ